MKRILPVAVLFISACTVADAQGCTQCRDNMASTPPATQAAYRHAIELLAASGLAFFAGGIVVLRRFR